MEKKSWNSDSQNRKESRCRACSWENPRNRSSWYSGKSTAPQCSSQMVHSLSLCGRDFGRHQLHYISELPCNQCLKEIYRVSISSFYKSWYKVIWHYIELVYTVHLYCNLIDWFIYFLHITSMNTHCEIQGKKCQKSQL